MPPRKGMTKRAPRVIGDLSDPDGFGIWVRRYLEWMRVHNYSSQTVRNHQSNLALFVDWCEERSLKQPREVTREILERYQRQLTTLRREDGRLQLTFQSQQVRLCAIRQFFRWLSKERVLLFNPASELELPRLAERLPQYVMTEQEAEQVLCEPDITTAAGLRDRAMLELLYSTGLRRLEISQLRLGDVDLERRTVMVRRGKGGKDRMVPIGERAIAWIEKYLCEARPEFTVLRDDGSLFLTMLGEGPSREWVSAKVSGYIRSANLGKTGSCHLFRHTMATLMLEGGADIRHIQEILGHTNLESTQVYTRVSIKQLQAIHAATHPGANLERRPNKARERGRANEDATERELFSHLAAEGDD
jgi:integrase/recombinase XerD